MNHNSQLMEDLSIKMKIIHQFQNQLQTFINLILIDLNTIKYMKELFMIQISQYHLGIFWFKQ
ncbi:unnamed protein product [Paramecium sonneborni]|uniref:Uncharacterized protein n=1 Tax=Paramecium sonneborni TaxID=65129 RepID=A0A8S1QE57_9CILI|nr:unnamed protein product [Paramecium sonneborni]